VCIYKSLTLSQYIYGAPFLASASTRAKMKMQTQQRGFLNFIGISTDRALRVHNIKPMEDFLNEKCVNRQRILKDPNHPLTISIDRNKYCNNIIVSRTNTTQYQNSVLQKSLRISRDGYVMFSNTFKTVKTRIKDESKRPRQHIKSKRSEQNSTKKGRKPNSTLYSQQRQPPLFKPHHQPSASIVYSKPKISMA
jgi:hypothetical protein